MSETDLYQCFNKHRKYFLVSITVYKAKNLNTLNADTFVAITFNDETKRTKTFISSDCPYFNEYFIFEIRTSLEELLRKNIRLAVVNANCFLKKNSLIGEININLSMIWRQKYHSYVKKWGVLEKIDNENDNGIPGYLQVDLSIISSDEPPAPAALQSYDEDIVEENLLLPNLSETSDVSSVRYIINIFHGKFVLKKDYILRIIFGSCHTRTRLIKSSIHCQWNEKIIFHEKFPSLNQLLIFELLTNDHYQWDVKCSCELSLIDMCWCINGNYNKPSFGPSYITFYEGVNRNVFYGKILISIDTEDIDKGIALSMNKKEDIIMPLSECDYWDEEVFHINMILINGDAFNTPNSRIKMSVSCKNNFGNSIDLDLKEYAEIEKLKLKFVHFNSTHRPLISLCVKLPDMRLKNQGNNLLKMLTREMSDNIKNFLLFEAKYHDNVPYQEKCLLMLFDDLKEMLVGLKTKIFHRSFKKLTKWDENHMKFIQSTLDISIEQINNLLKDSSNIKLKDYSDIRDLLSSAINEIQNLTAEIYLHFIKDGKILAYHKLNMLDYVYSQAFDSRGEFCGKLQSINVKPSSCTHSCDNCGCLFGMIQFVLWIGSEKEISDWLPQDAVPIDTNKINFTNENYHRCNIYVHQAKVQPMIDKSDTFQPKLVVLMNGLSERTRATSPSLTTTWNEVLVIENVKSFNLNQNLGSLIFLLYDETKKHIESIGIAASQVRSKINKEDSVQDPRDIRKIYKDLIDQFPPPLRWIGFMKNGNLTAEVLLSAELIPLHVPVISIAKREINDQIPPEIRPEIRKFHLEITFAGIRNAKSLSSFASGRYKVELSIGEMSLTSSFSNKKYKKNLNFLDPYASGYVLLPEQFQFWPPVIVRHLDCSHKKPQMIGAAMIRRPEKFFVPDRPKALQKYLLNSTIEEEVVEIEEDDERKPLLGISKSDKDFMLNRALSRCKIPKFFQSKSIYVDCVSLDSEYTWWTKFYNSNREEEFRNATLHQLTIFPNELEKQKEFEYFNDWAHPIELKNGNNSYALLKASIKISKCSGKEFFQTNMLNLPPPSFRFKRIPNLLYEIPVMLRIYVVEARNLRTRDIFNYSDAFIKIKYGNQVISDRAQYVPNQCNPIFGKRYQVSGLIPKDTNLVISIYDRDSFKFDDLIGKTKIDIEDRLRSKYGACCGLPKEFNSGGYNAWRNSQLPSEILSKVCSEYEINSPQYFPEHVQMAGIDFKDSCVLSKDENKKEKLALSVLNNFDKISGLGFKFVPEHVETRSIYRKDRPGVEQGKLLMWIEIFDPRKTIPEPLDITPIPPRNYELRVIIWNAKDVLLDEKNIFATKMSDIYVKGWLSNVNDAQYTDVHYRSLNGDANFNWRMIFPFKFSIAEDMMIVKRDKSAFEKIESFTKMPAVLNLQIWDNDTFTPDDFLGTANINLSHLQRPLIDPEKCNLDNKDAADYVNIFGIVDGSLRGWFPVRGNIDESGKIKQTGKLELELQVLPEEKAKSDQAGLGRDGPHKLSNPDRPDTSFNWFKNPWKSTKHIVWPTIRKFYIYAIIVAIVLIILLLIMLSLYNIPQKIITKTVGL